MAWIWDGCPCDSIRWVEDRFVLVGEAMMREWLLTITKDDLACLNPCHEQSNLL